MIMKKFAEKINACVITNETDISKQITGVYACDLLSWVMSHASKGNAWITVHTHLNIVAVALLTEISCIIIPEGITVEEATINRAVCEGVTILSTKLSTYEICCIAHDMEIGIAEESKNKE